MFGIAGTFSTGGAFVESCPAFCGVRCGDVEVGPGAHWPFFARAIGQPFLFFAAVFRPLPSTFFAKLACFAAAAPYFPAMASAIFPDGIGCDGGTPSDLCKPPLANVIGAFPGEEMVVLPDEDDFDFPGEDPIALSEQAESPRKTGGPPARPGPDSDADRSKPAAVGASRDLDC